VPRKLNDWLSGYLKYTEYTEPPIAFHTWVGLGTISAALERRVHMKWFPIKIYPNQYIVLVGPSGRSRKSVALGIGKGLLQDVGAKLVSESIIREALIRFIKNSVTNYTDPDTGKIEFQNAVTVVSSELSVFLGERDTKFLKDLTNWYDGEEGGWTYETKHQGTDRINNICFNMLGATAPDWLPSMLPQEAVGGGFSSRIIFVVEEQKGKIVPDPNAQKPDESLKQELLEDLEQIRMLCGEYTFSDEAHDTYMEWYPLEEEKMRAGNYPVNDPKFEGYCERRATHIKKIGMALSASRGDDLVITIDDFNRALKILTVTEGKMSRAFRSVGTAKFAQITEAVMIHIQLAGRLKRSDIMRRFARDIDGFIMDVIENTLVKMKLIRIRAVSSDGDIEYEYLGSDVQNVNTSDDDSPS